MTNPVWPATLPQKPFANKWTGSPQRNKASFQPEIGPSIDRRRGSSFTHVFQAGFDFTSNAMVATFIAWFEDDLYDGTLPFEWDDPLDGLTYLWKFTSDDPPYTINSHSGTYHELTFKVVRLYPV